MNPTIQPRQCVDFAALVCACIIRVVLDRPGDVVHTGKQLWASGIDVDIDGEAADLSALFADYQAHDRFGIVVTEPFGSVGASLLISAATAAFFEVRPERRNEAPTYPEIYCFHFGGRHGDHSYYDFWPPRKEVFVDTVRPIDLLEAINVRAITRLAIPDTAPGDIHLLTEGPSTWAEQASLRDRLSSCFAYGLKGTAEQADVILKERDPSTQENVVWTLDPVPAYDAIVNQSEEEALASLPGLSVLEDNFRWAAWLRSRLDEISEADRQVLIAEREARRLATGGRTIESYRRLSDIEALVMLAGLSGSVGDD
jgi:hypothetical protein